MGSGTQSSQSGGEAGYSPPRPFGFSLFYIWGDGDDPQGPAALEMLENHWPGTFLNPVEIPVLTDHVPIGAHTDH